jgi:hypothetical protein
MSDVPPINHVKIKALGCSKIRIKTEDEFSTKQEALDYYRSHFGVDGCSYIPEVITFLNKIAMQNLRCHRHAVVMRV